MSRTAVVVMGVAGCGKSTVAGLVAEQLGWPLGEADDLHPAANVVKMSAGTPLTDEDRWPWLATVREWIQARPGDCVLTCSALRRSYREALRADGVTVRFAHLDGSAEQLERRLAARTGHFMPPALLVSQLATLERLEADEDGVVVGVGAAPDVVAEAVVRALGLGVAAR